jgi:hypothetical protein
MNMSRNLYSVRGFRRAQLTLDGEYAWCRPVDRWRRRCRRRRLTALLERRQRRVLVRWLRRTARHRFDPHPFSQRRETLLGNRVTAIRGELLEIAAELEQAQHPSRACMGALRELLADGCGSPLYNASQHPSELRASLHYIRAGLAHGAHGGL